MINGYLKDRERFLKCEQEKNNYIIFMCLGAFLFFSSIFKFLYSYKTFIYDLFYILVASFGFFILIFNTINPNLVANKLSIVFNIGNFIKKSALYFFKFILAIIYILIVFPVGIIIKFLHEKKYIKDTNFIKYSGTQINKKRGILNVLQIIKIFFNEKYILMLPIILLLISIGLFLFFAQSTVITPFIYTIF